MKISEIIMNKYKLRMPPTVYYDLLSDVAEVEEEQEPTTKNNLGVDCISRKAVLDELGKWDWQELYLPIHFKENIVDVLPSVTPQEPRKGHWIEEFNDLEGEVRFTCSCCGKYQLFGTDFCYHCGAKMVEPQESEVEDGNVD